MEYAFFFSYARLDANPDLDGFYEKLSDEVRRRSGRKPDEVAFRDEEGIQLGERWDKSVGEALHHSKVFVYIASPTYYKRENCAIEWTMFQQRIASADCETPLMIPINWEEAEPPEIAKKIHYMDASFPSDYQKGLRRLLCRLDSKDHDYLNIVEALADAIVAAAGESPLTPPDTLPSYNKVPNAFKTSIDAPSGPRVAHCYFIVGDRQEMEPVRSAQNLGQYGVGREEDWRPYDGWRLREESELTSGETQLVDVTAPVSQVVARIVEGKGEFKCCLKALGDPEHLVENFDARLRAAERDNTVVLLFVDCWAMWLPTLAKIMQRFDEHNFINCEIVIPWNDQDNEAVRREKELVDKVDSVFSHQAVESLHGVTPLAFSSEVLDRIDRVRSQIHSRGKRLRSFTKDVANNTQLWHKPTLSNISLVQDR